MIVRLAELAREKSWLSTRVTAADGHDALAARDALFDAWRGLGLGEVEGEATSFTLGRGELEVLTCGKHARERSTVPRVLASRVRVAVGPPQDVTTPGATTVAEVVRQLATPASGILKTMVCDVDGRTVVAVVAGDRRLHLGKLATALHARGAKLASVAVVERLTGAPLGWAGPVGLRATVVLDAGVVPGAPYVSGANRPEVHIKDVVPGRDFDIDHHVDIAWAEPGDACPACGAPLALEKRRVVGRVRGPTLERAGEPWLVTAELDALALPTELRLTWPPGHAPADVHVVALNREASDAALAVLSGRVLVDDRTIKPSDKLAFAEMLGIPTIVVAAARSLDEGFGVRRGDERLTLSLAELSGSTVS